jgi:hypothetical protein
MVEPQPPRKVPPRLAILQPARGRERQRLDDLPLRHQPAGLFHPAAPRPRGSIDNDCRHAHSTQRQSPDQTHFRLAQSSRSVIVRLDAAHGRSTDAPWRHAAPAGTARAVVMISSDSVGTPWARIPPAAHAPSGPSSRRSPSNCAAAGTPNLSRPGRTHSTPVRCCSARPGSQASLSGVSTPVYSLPACSALAAFRPR